MNSAAPMRERDDSVVVVGSGLAGLACALALAPRPVTLITKTTSLAGGSSLLAQGGIAAAIGADDSPEKHAADTLSTGAGLSDPERVRQLTGESGQSLQWLLDRDIPFDRTSTGALALAQEAAHGAPRVVHAGGDATGRVLMQSLIERVNETQSINVLDDTFAYDLVVSGGQVQGLVAYNSTSGWTFHRSTHVVLATGGIGTAWWHTTNPVEATGDGLAIAARAGATLSDLEFVQFHPTALAADSAKNGSSLPLLTEALRGAGALLVDGAGTRFMLTEHASAELAPRDVVARAIHRRTRNGEPVYLDLRPVIAAGLGSSFPQALAIAANAELDPSCDLLPVTPAAHYHMGGVQTDHCGRTSIDGLWACGEVAATGVHGANRLASNSLLEALTYGRHVAADVSTSALTRQNTPVSTPVIPEVPLDTARAEIRSIEYAMRTLMSRRVGILRSGTDLEVAFSRLSDLEEQLIVMHDGHASGDIVRLSGELRNRLLVARLITLAALRREESRGAHYRDDFPLPNMAWQHRQAITVKALSEAHREIGRFDILGERADRNVINAGFRDL
jgi:L-aspartate oxidase